MSYLWRGVGIDGWKKVVVRLILVLFVIITLLYAWKRQGDEEFKDLEQDKINLIKERKYK